MNLVHVVEPDFPEAIIDIVIADKQNLWVGMFVHTKLTYSESRIELPLWMLSTESVHGKIESFRCIVSKYPNRTYSKCAHKTYTLYCFKTS